MQTNIDPIIEVRDLSKVVRDASGALTLLDAVSLSIRRGGSTAIVGASGSGKSTLLGLLAGLDLPSSGSIRLLGQELTALNEDGRAALRRGQVGFVFQSFQLMPHLTALENVMLPLELLAANGDGGLVSRAHGAEFKGTTTARPTGSAREQALALLDQVGLAHRTRHYPALLSGGEQQRVALARAFVTRPQLLFADEPTGSLDAANGAAVIELMFELNRASGATLVLVTHDTELARRCAQVITLEAGRLTQTSTLEQARAQAQAR
jgi:putative ABC transport system ATP-binding protein